MKFRYGAAFALAYAAEKGNSTPIIELETGRVEEVECSSCTCADRSSCRETCNSHSGSEAGADIAKFYALLEKMTPRCSVDAKIRIPIEVPPEGWCQTNTNEASERVLVVEAPIIEDMGLYGGFQNFENTPDVIQFHQGQFCSGAYPMEFVSTEASSVPLSKTDCPVMPGCRKPAKVGEVKDGVFVVRLDVGDGHSFQKRSRIALKPSTGFGQNVCVDEITKVEWVTTVGGFWTGLPGLPRKPTVDEASANVFVGLIVVLLAFSHSVIAV